MLSISTYKNGQLPSKSNAIPFDFKRKLSTKIGKKEAESHKKVKSLQAAWELFKSTLSLAGIAHIRKGTTKAKRMPAWLTQVKKLLEGGFLQKRKVLPN